MRKKYSISFRAVQSPILEPVTKFGGQPVWMDTPTWPLSRLSGRPMTFICQIQLAKEIFGNVETGMAYIFMSGNDDKYDKKTWDPNSGENAVVLQPGVNKCTSTNCETGPSIEVWKEISDRGFRRPFPCEFLVELSKATLDQDAFDREQEFENKIGGYPQFLQFEEFPEGRKDDWQLLLQLDSCKVPFETNFGDAGVGYAFISLNGRKGKFLWQCG